MQKFFIHFKNNKSMANPQDKVKIITKDKEIEGILMPTESEDSVFIKLDSGYNIGIDKKTVKKIDILQKKVEKQQKKKAIKESKSLKKIAILHTGGTIASKVNYETGGVIAAFSAEDLLEMVPELATISNIETELVANMMSEDMRTSNYKKLAKAIKKHAESGADGIIIGHGTDTLAYTAAALSFIFESINIPVLLVGSQRSSDRGSTDSASNLICAAHFITQTDFAGVAVCMHHTSDDKTCAILPGTKTRKMHTSRRDAFKPINADPIALIDYEKGKISHQANNYPKKQKESKIILKDKFDESVGLLKTHPFMGDKIFEFFTKNYDAIILEATGLGQAPTNKGEEHLKNYELLKKYIQKGGIVAVTSQCIYGRVHPDVYVNLRRLANIGCIFCEDMLPETALIKLSWLLGNYDAKKASELLTQDLRGEISDRSLYKEEFIG